MSRIQGTDGIRATTASSRDHPGLSPLAAFLEANVITEEFVEMYAYCYCKMVGEGEVVVGWDPRDPGGMFTSAAVKGIRRAGCDCISVGIAATPCIAMYMVYRGSPGGIVVSASHNFKTQNGVKLFKKGGMKLLPADDVVLTSLIKSTSYQTVRNLPLTGAYTDASVEAEKVFSTFHLASKNSWAVGGKIPLAGPLIVDPANGALSRVAASVLSELVTCEVIEVNADITSGNVNVDGGVADLEDVTVITRDDINFKTHKGVAKLFDLRAGVAAVFDADGDRFYGLTYDASTDTVLVLSGDETAVNIAQEITPKGDFIITVESDLQAGRAATTSGFTPILTGVGDKWLLSRAMTHQSTFSVACEASGHNITKGYLRDKSGSEVLFFAGNGLKAAVNTFAVMSRTGKTPVQFATPFTAGYKKTFYVYYTKKEMLSKGSELVKRLETELRSLLEGFGDVKAVSFVEEPDMLYISVAENGVQHTGIFIRNSGTEEKTGINIRGRLPDANFLKKIGAALSFRLYSLMKDPAHVMSLAEPVVLASLASSATPTVPSTVHKQRLLKEMAKGGLIEKTVEGYKVTEFGERVVKKSAL